jgi:hypothetical protein
VRAFSDASALISPPTATTKRASKRELNFSSFLRSSLLTTSCVNMADVVDDDGDDDDNDDDDGDKDDDDDDDGGSGDGDGGGGVGGDGGDGGGGGGGDDDEGAECS